MLICSVYILDYLMLQNIGNLSEKCYIKCSSTKPCSCLRNMPYTVC